MSHAVLQLLAESMERVQGLKRRHGVGIEGGHGLEDRM
jgi:hypothetical protein